MELKNTDLPQLVCIVGKKQKGKSTLAKQYVESGYLELEVKEFLLPQVWKVLGWQPSDKTEYEAFKSEVLNFRRYITPKSSQNTWHAIRDIDLVTGRDLIINVVDLVKQLAGDDFYAKQFKKEAKNKLLLGQNIVVPDVRSVYEYMAALGLHQEGICNTTFINCNFDNEQLTVENFDDKHTELIAQFWTFMDFKHLDKINHKLVADTCKNYLSGKWDIKKYIMDSLNRPIGGENC